LKQDVAGEYLQQFLPVRKNFTLSCPYIVLVMM